MSNQIFLTGEEYAYLDEDDDINIMQNEDLTIVDELLKKPCEMTIECSQSIHSHYDEEDTIMIKNARNLKLSKTLEESDNSGDNLINESNVDSTSEEFIDLVSDGGVKKQILRIGEGDTYPNYSNKVHIRYTGYLQVGKSLKPFDRSDRNVCFHLGKGAVIRGLDIGIATMTKNEISLFVIQPEYAYGHMGNPPSIPPYAILFFEVELLDWKLEDLSPKKNEGILRKILQKGEGTAYPNDGAFVKIKICGTYKDQVIEEREIDFILNEGFDIGITDGIEIALMKFKLNETSILYLKGRYALEVQQKINETLTAESIVEYEITLLSFEKAKEIWEMNSDEKYEKSIKMKGKGIEYIQNGNYKSASKQFKKIILCLENEPGITPDLVASREILLISAYLNESLCQLKMENFVDAIKMCSKVLKINQKNEKALYRRGQCYLSINDCDEALEDFLSVLEINPSNSACKKLIASCKAKLSEQKTKDKNMYSNIFRKSSIEYVKVSQKVSDIVQIL